MYRNHRTVPYCRAPRSFIFLVIALGGMLVLTRSLLLADPSHGDSIRQVPVPFSFHDNTGMQWDVQQDGCIGPAQADIFDAGGRLFVGPNEAYAPNAQVALFDGPRNELVFPAQPLAGLTVNRRVFVDAKLGFCRWVEILENSSGSAIKTQVHVNFDLGAAVQSSQNVNDPKTQKALGVAIFDGTRGIAMLGAGAGGQVFPAIVSQQGNDQVDFTWDVEVPAHKSAAIVHLQAIRPSVNDAQTFLQKLTDRQVLHDLPNSITKIVANFVPRNATFGDVELLRGELLDVVELRGGDQYKGTIQEKTLTLQTTYGMISLPPEKVLAMVAVGEFRPAQLLVTRDGEALCGTLQSPVIHVQLSSGQVTSIPIGSIKRFGFRKQPGDPEEFQYEHPILMLRNGDRIAVQFPAGPIPVSTRYGNLKLDPRSIGALVFQADDQPMHQVLLTDGSRIAALIGQDSLALLPTATGAVKPVSFPIAGVSRLQFTQKVEEPGESSAVLSLSTGDRLAGALGGKPLLETAFDTIEINASEVRAVRHAGSSPVELQVTLWDDTVLSGRFKGDSIDITLKSGPALHVPTALIDAYSQPEPMPPPMVIEKLRGLVAGLNSDDWKRADRATSQLVTMGPRITAALRAIRPEQAKAVQDRIDVILLKLDGKSEVKPVAPTTKPAAPDDANGF